MRKPALFLALSLWLGISSTALAQTQNASQNMTATPPGIQAQPLTAKPLNQRQLQGIVAALASYHEIDASFSDAIRLASTGTFGQQAAALSGSGLNDANDSDAAMAQNRVQPQGPELANENQGSDGFRHLDVAPGQDPGLNPLLGLGYDFAEDGSGRNLNRRDYADSVVELPGTVDANDQEANMAQAPQTRSDLNEALNIQNNPYRQYFSLPAVGTLNAQGFANALVGRIESDRGILALNALKLQPKDFKLNKVPAGQLVRLGERNFKASAGYLDPLKHEEGTYELFSSSFSTPAGTSEVLLTSEPGSASNSGLDMLLSNRSSAYSGLAYRASEALGNGGIRLTTSVMNEVSNGGMLEILEERLIDSQGQGQGLGLFQMRDQQGVVVSGTLKTHSGTDGSLLSYLVLDQGQTLVIREAANGQTQMAWLTDAQNTITWQNLPASSFSDAIKAVFE